MYYLIGFIIFVLYIVLGTWAIKKLEASSEDDNDYNNERGIKDV